MVLSVYTKSTNQTKEKLCHVTLNSRALQNIWSQVCKVDLLNYEVCQAELEVLPKRKDFKCIKSFHKDEKELRRQSINKVKEEDSSANYEARSKDWRSLKQTCTMIQRLPNRCKMRSLKLIFFLNMKRCILSRTYEKGKCAT